MRNTARALCLVALLAGAAHGADFATQMMEATYKLYNRDSTATGFFVTDPAADRAASNRFILVTATHVLAKMTGKTMLVVLRRPLPDGTYTRRDFSVTIRQDGKPLWTAHPTEDAAAMRVALPADANVTALPFESLATEDMLKAINLHMASPLFVLGFPTRFEANGAGFPVARHASVASYPLFPINPHKTFIADFATFAGDSGGPVFVPDARRKEAAEMSTPLIVGIILAQFRHDENVQTLYEERTLHHPLDLATVLQAQYVRKTIDRLPK